MGKKIKEEKILTNQEEYEYELYSPGEGEIKRLRRVGYKNTQDKINEETIGIGLENYIEIDKNGKPVAVIKNQREGFYGDFTQVPQTMSEARNQLITAKETLKWIEQEKKRQIGEAADKKKAEDLKTAETKANTTETKVIKTEREVK